MISVVCVYGNREILDRILLPSLRKQEEDYEEILLDNTQNRYKSAAEALNAGASKATGKYIMFVHCDVELGSKTWLGDVERILDTIPDLGVAGVIGRDFDGNVKGLVCDRGQDFGNTVINSYKVQTLDEVVLIVPKIVFEEHRFDEIHFDGWHCYGADICLSIHSARTYVIPGYVYHRSKDSARNISTQRKYQKRLWEKHRQTIYTTIGTVNWLSANFYPVWDLALKTYWKIFPTWIEWLKKDTKGCESVLDLGCGYNSPVQFCDIPYKVGVEIFKPYLDESRKKALHNEYVDSDVNHVGFSQRSFDIVLASGVLEHLDSFESNLLLERIEVWARKKVIITTPNGFISQDGYDENLYQVHKCGWTVDRFRAGGYRVQGINGLKCLRGPRSKIKYKPAFLWERISDVTQLFTRYYPKLAFQLYAVKERNGGG